LLAKSNPLLLPLQPRLLLLLSLLLPLLPLLPLPLPPPLLLLLLHSAHHLLPCSSLLCPTPPGRLGRYVGQNSQGRLDNLNHLRRCDAPIGAGLDLSNLSLEQHLLSRVKVR
jgi:hypothetical protein